ncbi:hypothetical protein L1887_61127 [Cichorium endivia]|nr:hypothetical protein L1887_61127 [Cichorium endivia]
MATVSNEIATTQLIREHADSSQDLEELFRAAIEPNRISHKPMRERNLPLSFFKPPETGTKSASHSRESSIDQSKYVKRIPSSNLDKQQHIININQLAATENEPVESCGHSGVAFTSALLTGHPAEDAFGGATADQSTNGADHTDRRSAAAATTGRQPCTAAAAAEINPTAIQHIRQLSDINQIPLPEGWNQAIDQSTGRMYFINHNEKTTTWRSLDRNSLDYCNYKWKWEQQQQEQQLQAQLQNVQIQPQAAVPATSAASADHPESGSSAATATAADQRCPHPANQITGRLGGTKNRERPDLLPEPRHSIDHLARPTNAAQRRQAGQSTAAAGHAPATGGRTAATGQRAGRTADRRRAGHHSAAAAATAGDHSAATAATADSDSERQSAERLSATSGSAASGGGQNSKRNNEILNQQQLFSQSMVVNQKENDAAAINHHHHNSNNLNTAGMDPFLSGENHSRQESADSGIDSGLGREYSLPNTPDDMLVLEDEFIGLESLAITSMDLDENMEHDDMLPNAWRRTTTRPTF